MSFALFLNVCRARTAFAGCALALLLVGTSRAQFEPSFESRIYTRPAAIFFPPFPPPLDLPVSRVATPVRPTPPTELAEYASEFFYPALGSQLTARTLTEKQKQQLAAFRAARHGLVEELRHEVTAQREAEPAARQQALSALARRQAPRLAELEKTADQLRVELIPPERNWNDLREWKLSDRERRGFSPIEIAQVMRAYAFYHKGLLPAQRRLLREIALELANAAESTEKATAAQPYVFFSPDMARVEFPTNLAAELAAKIASYQSKKALVKKELYDTIHENDGKVALFSGALKALPEKQAARIAELEKIAEEIRVGLGDFAASGANLPHSPLPVAMTAQLSDIVQRHARAQQTATSKLERLVGRARFDQLPVLVNHRFDESGLKYAVVPRSMTAARAEVAEKIDALREALAAVADEYGKTLAGLVNERDEVRRAAGEQLGLTDMKAIDNALTVAMRAAARRETESPYRDYRMAVFLPGLSPEQRRLLLNAAVDDLRMPLPRGEMQPSRRANSW